MKAFAFAILAIASVHAASSSSAHLNQMSLSYRQAMSFVTQTANKLHPSVRLMDDDDFCNNKEDVTRLSDLTKSQCEENYSEVIDCTCDLPMYKALISPLLVTCDAKCSDVFEVLNEDSDDALDSVSGTKSFTNKACPKRTCFGRFFGGMKKLGSLKLPSTCSENSATIKLFAGIFGSAEKSIDFFCAKGADEKYCGIKFEEQSTAIESCPTGDESESCICGNFASLGCCAANAIAFLNSTSPSESNAFMKQLKSTCDYDLSKMKQCPNQQQKSLKRAQTKLKFKAFKCDLSTSAVAYQIQQQTATKADVEIADVSVVVDTCECCAAATNRRLLATGSVEASVTLSGDDASDGADNLNKAVKAGTFSEGNDNLGAVDKDSFTEAKVETVESDISDEDDDNSAGALTPSLLAVALLATIAFF